VGLVAVDAHSRRRLEAIVRQCSPAAARGALLDDPHAVARLVDATDLVLDRLDDGGRPAAVRA
jgi:hypothetical protein